MTPSPPAARQQDGMVSDAPAQAGDDEARAARLRPGEPVELPTGPAPHVHAAVFTTDASLFEQAPQFENLHRK